MAGRLKPSRSYFRSPGRNLEGIYFAMQFLEGWQKYQMGNMNKYIDAKGKDVVVIGGGDTGCDCIGTSLRMVGIHGNRSVFNLHMIQCRMVGYC